MELTGRRFRYANLAAGVCDSVIQIQVVVLAELPVRFRRVRIASATNVCECILSTVTQFRLPTYVVAYFRILL